ncbi:YheC/YheD family protein [Brevibacillus sp. B_LB10_24]|uniref:YheC/YheD family protein n=1 Tax=Brevibacillus sp. B_LB10_24 TaxID=3380645 RepID=UPI0038BD9A9E
MLRRDGCAIGRLNTGKWAKYNILLQDKLLAPHLPDTNLFHKESLADFLNKYKTVVIKPSGGSGGTNLIKVSTGANGRFIIHVDNTAFTANGLHALHSYIQRLKKKEKVYLIQQYIPLARVNNRPFDIRIMVQRRPNSPWRVTGGLAKVAGPGYVVTNVKHSGGRVLPLQTAINQSTLKQLGNEFSLIKLSWLAIRTAKRLSEVYPTERTIGIDMGVDTNGQIWIIEANFRPAASLFLKLKNKQMYRNIITYRRRYAP